MPTLSSLVTPRCPAVPAATTKLPLWQTWISLMARENCSHCWPFVRGTTVNRWIHEGPRLWIFNVSFVVKLNNFLIKSLITGVFMDLSKAFDCFSHSLLIGKLYAYGELIGLPLSVLWTTWVKIGTARSSWAELTKGLPQGSILGRMFFYIFTGDLFLFIEKCILYNYADENSMSYSLSTLQNVLQIQSLTAELLLIGLALMEWKRTLINSILLHCRQIRPMTLNWNWTRIPHSDLKNQLRLWEAS